MLVMNLRENVKGGSGLHDARAVTNAALGLRFMKS